MACKVLSQHWSVAVYCKHLINIDNTTLVQPMDTNVGLKKHWSTLACSLVFKMKDSNKYFAARHILCYIICIEYIINKMFSILSSLLHYIALFKSPSIMDSLNDLFRSKQLYNLDFIMVSLQKHYCPYKFL